MTLFFDAMSPAEPPDGPKDGTVTPWVAVASLPFVLGDRGG